MEGLLILLLFPLAWPFVAKRIWDTTITWQEMGLNIVIASVLTVAAWSAGVYTQTADTEIWNGQVIGKERDTVPCSHSYDCMCTTDSKGNRSCSTCYDHLNDYDWVVHTTIGDININRIDRQGEDEPPRWTAVRINEPIAQEHSFTNYVKAVPESLFNVDSKTIIKPFEYLIPSYPSVHDYYRIDRVINMGTKTPDNIVNELNSGLNNILRALGPSKQANIVLVLVNTNDPNYRYALESAWLGGKKNDIVIMLGVTEYPKIAWVDVMAWALNLGNENFHVLLRDELLSQQTINTQKIVPVVANFIQTKFDRPPMAQFETLKGEIDPPMWAIILAVLCAIGGSMGLTYYFHRYDVVLFRRR